MTVGRTREDLIDLYVDRIMLHERKDVTTADRGYVLDLVASAAKAVDGHRIVKRDNAEEGAGRPNPRRIA